MSSSTSSSEARPERFWLWLAAFFVLAGVLLNLDIWGGMALEPKRHLETSVKFGAEVDYLMMGDSKVSPFSTNYLIPWLQERKGLAFFADSVTPVFHYRNLRRIFDRVPSLRPTVAFISVGANNFNAHGLHVKREYTLFNELSMRELWQLTWEQGEPLVWAEALLSRVLPIYGRRVFITHLWFHFGRDDAFQTRLAAASLTTPDPLLFPVVERDPVLDRNYLDIYRRSMYPNYENSPIATAALRGLIRMLQDRGTEPIIITLPLAPEMRALEEEMVGDAFVSHIAAVAREEGVEFHDFQHEDAYEFADINHLSARGAHEFCRERLAPLLARNTPRQRQGAAGE